MKKSIILVLSVFTLSCTENPKENPKVHQPNHVLVFIDKSQSIDLSKPFLANKYQNELSGIIAQNINGEGDKLEMFYIHENTSKGRCLSMMSRSTMGDIQGKNATDLEALKMSFDLSLNREKAIFQKQANSKMMQSNTSSSNSYTDVLASIQVIANAAETAQNLKVFYFSDMVESMKGAGRRDFQANPPSGESEAIEWAKIDAKRYKDLVLGSPEITIISPFEATASSKENNPFVFLYWKSLFEELGVSMVNEI